MIQDIRHIQHYLAEEGKVIVPKLRDENTLGIKSIWLASFDTIDNYEEIDEPKSEEVIDE